MIADSHGAARDMAANWRDRLQLHSRRVARAETWLLSGRISRATGMVLEATGLKLPIGSACRVECAAPGSQWIQAEVVGFHGHTLFLMPLEPVAGLYPGAHVQALRAAPGSQHCDADASGDGCVRRLPVGEYLMGRVVDPMGRPLDGKGELAGHSLGELTARPINPLHRAPVDTVLDVGVRALNGLLTVGRGQRMGLFAGSGVGKSVLMGMMARHTEAQVIVVGLIGERGREVKEFIHRNLGDEGLRRAVVIAAPADVSAVLRKQAAIYATRVAEYFRDQGRHVLLMMDSLTRYAMAQREIALALGEAPATKGYPPSVFACLPALVERAGMGLSDAQGCAGSITAFYTVLAEGDDQQDPVADAARAILDGHVVLSRNLAQAGHYPAIDIEASASRVMAGIVSTRQLALAMRFRRLLATYQRNHDLISVGAYIGGSDPLIDEAIAAYPKLAAYLQQDAAAACDWQSALDALALAVDEDISVVPTDCSHD